MHFEITSFIALTLLVLKSVDRAITLEVQIQVAAMDSDVPDEFWQGIDQFNRGEFYACHDTLEAIWMEAPIYEKKFFQGILQIAVGLYHLENHNWRGAVILLGEGIHRLHGYQPVYAGIDVEQLIDRATDVLSRLQTIDPACLAQVVLTLDPLSESDARIFLPRPIIQKADPSRE